MNMADPLHFREPMARHVSWRAGGAADRFFIATSIQALAEFLRSLPNKEPLLFVGLGSNLLVRDGGFRGTVMLLHSAKKNARLESDLVYAEAGVASPKVARFAALQHLVGAEFLAGIPAASALATFLCHGWPALRRLQGAAPERVRSRAVLSAPATKARSFTAMLRGRRWRDGAVVRVEPSGPQESHQMVPFARWDCLILCPPGTEVLAPGTEVDVLPYPWSAVP